MRLKRYLEMRGADGGPWRSLCALPALWVGLLYDQAALDAAWDRVRDWTIEEHEHLRAEVPRQGLRTPFRGGTVQDLARRCSRSPMPGCTGRAEEDWFGQDERQFLTALRGIAESAPRPPTRSWRCSTAAGAARPGLGFVLFLVRPGPRARAPGGARFRGGGGGGGGRPG